MRRAADENGLPGRRGPVVCELARRGKLLVGEPYFEPATPLVIDRKTSGGASPGDLAAVSTGRGRARVERVLGSASSIHVVLDGLLVEAGVRPVGGRCAAAVREAEALPADPVADGTGRVDLRELLAFTIDPDEAKDHDDAISIRRDGDAVRVWVHIADVAAAVRQGSALDRDAAERAVSVYVPGTVEPMLPERLSSGLCSLLPGRDRSCVTVEVPFGPELEPGEPAFYRSVIRSREQLSYTRAEAILGGRERCGEDLAEALELADRVARELRRRRHRRGALRVEAAEVVFAFDGRGGVEDARVEREPAAHALVEELMILANESVAALLAGRRREALYRVHDRPEPQSVALLLARLEALGVPTPPAPEEMTSAQAAGVAARASVLATRYAEQSGRGREALPSLVLRALQRARYDPANRGHSGLASRAYCHFTSPIRRYPDVICHRALLLELGTGSDPLSADLAELAGWTSVREREADAIERSADAICAAWLLDRRLFELGWDACFDGEVIGAIGSGLFVRFDGVFEGYLPARLLPGDYFELDPLATALVGRRGGGRYRLGDPVTVRVEGIDRASGKVNLALCENFRPG